jgi:thiamine biosynthesis lipoprotein
MGTVVSIEVVLSDDTSRAVIERRVDDAFHWFKVVEAACTRFDASSEVMRLATCVDTPVHVSVILYQAVTYAIAVAHATDGAFDPTIGARLEAMGLNREYLTGSVVSSGVAPAATYRDVSLDDATGTITLARPLVLDLGAVAKGLAVDLAVKALAECRNFAVDAGGDIYFAGTNRLGESWRVGIRHPRDRERNIDTLHVRDVAVCTSGDYEPRSAATDHHILDARRGEPARELASVTVVAPSAMVADALGTAAFALGPDRGLAFLREQGVEGLLVTPALECLTTPGLARFRVADGGNRA